MRVELWVPTATPISTPELLAFIGREAEERGFSCLWVGEHVVLFEEYASSYPYADDGRIPAPPGSGLLEPLTTLSFLAAHTTDVRLGTAMVLLPQRNPVYTAKEVSTLDWLSHGRVDFGIGVGWLEEEFNAVNVPWPHRGRRTDEYLEVLTTLWCDETSAYEGEFYSLNPCAMFPKPVQEPHPPIHIGGESDAALRRTARYADGWLPQSLGPDAGLLAELHRLREEYRPGAPLDVGGIAEFLHVGPTPAGVELPRGTVHGGADRIAEALPPLLRAVRDEGHPVVWTCDPMHGNTFTAEGGRKTRRFDDILTEIKGFFTAHRSVGTWPGGVHVELTGDDVTECLGGVEDIVEDQLDQRYTTACDPRLNARQSLDLAFRVAELLRG